MNKKNALSAIIFLLPGFIFPLSSQVLASNLEITPTLYHFNYQEFDSLDRVLDTEDGVLPGIKFGFTPDYKNRSFNTHVAFYSGTIDYDGQTQSGVPHRTDTIEELFNLGLTFSPASQLGSANPIQTFLGFQYWQWDRDIQSTDTVQGLHELYRWGELEVGINFQPRDSDLAGYWLSISALYIVSPEMVLYLPSSQAGFNLGSKIGYRVRGGKSWQYSEEASVSIGLFIESWEFGRSDLVFTDDFFGQSAFLVEPRSESFHSGLEFSLKF